MMTKIQINLIKKDNQIIQMMIRQMIKINSQNLRLRSIHKIMPLRPCSLEKEEERK